MKNLTWLTRIKAVLLDVDGVLYRGKQILPGAREFMAFLVEREIPFAYVTNNSTLTAEDYASRLVKRGFPATARQVIGSAETTAHVLTQMYAQKPRIFPVGERGLMATLQKYGFPLATTAEETTIVVAGLDRAITYEKLAEATYAIRRGARFFGTNPDKTFPTERGLAPGAGSILAALEAATDTPPTIVGKPEAPIFRLALERVAATPETAVMIGDRLDTDIAGAKRLGMKAILVLTGVTTAVPDTSSQAPDLVVENLAQLMSLWKQL